MSETVHCESCGADHELRRLGAYQAMECPLVPAGQAYVIDLDYMRPPLVVGMSGKLLVLAPGDLARLEALGVQTA